MVWLIVSCKATRHIVPVQRHLFKKYVPDADLRYIDLGTEDVETWTTNVLRKLGPLPEHIIFGLDDFLPIDHWSLGLMPPILTFFDRIELGWGGSRKGEYLPNIGYNMYADDELYRVSCQFSIWRSRALKDLLATVRSPWKFETKGELEGAVLSLAQPFRYIEESALSGRQPGKINLCGLRKEDIEELIDLKLVDPAVIIYGWAGNEQRTKESYGTKYAEYY